MANDGVFEEGAYDCPQRVMDAVQGVDLKDALAIRIAEDLISKRYSAEIKAEVSEMMSQLDIAGINQLVALIAKFPQVSSLELFAQYIEWKSHVSAKDIPEE